MIHFVAVRTSIGFFISHIALKEQAILELQKGGDVCPFEHLLKLIQ